jgi:hypothetical protein
VLLVTTRIAASLTGLSTEQLREWSSRRALIPADIQKRGRGSPAQYSWQTILMLRIASLLKARFHLELHAHRGLFQHMHEALVGISFLKLWGASLAIYDTEHWEILGIGDAQPVDVDAIVIQLNPHLEVLAGQFAMPRPLSSAQLELFPARLIVDDRVGIDGRSDRGADRIEKRRRA